jgi:peroxiredoxin Q/BCP
MKDFLGQWIVLYFYPKDNTPACTLEAINFSQNLEKFEQKNATIIGISPDSTSKHRNFEKKHDLTIKLLSDPQHNTLKEYDVWKPKKMYGKEFLGVIRSTFLIDPNGNIVHIWSKVRVNGHTDDVLNKINEIKNRM